MWIKMMCEQQRQQVTFMEMSKKKGDHGSRRRYMEEGKVRVEIVDMSGMSLHSFPIHSLNLATISNLDLSNNNLQVYSFPSIFFSFHFLILSSNIFLFTTQFKEGGGKWMKSFCIPHPKTHLNLYKSSLNRNYCLILFNILVMVFTSTRFSYQPTTRPAKADM